MATVGKFAVLMSATTGPFSKDMRRAESAVTRFGRVGTSTMARTSNLFNAGIGRMAAGITAFVSSYLAVRTVLNGIRDAFEVFDTAAKASDKLGVPIENLLRLQHAGALAGLEADKITIGLQNLARRSSEAAQGTGEAKDALQELGFDVTKFKNLRADQQFLMIADRLGNMANKADKARIAYQIFGRTGVDMINLMWGGSDALKAAADEADRLGITISRVEAAKIEQANDSITKMKSAWRGVSAELAVNMAPIITEVADRFTSWITKGSDGVENQLNPALNQTIQILARIEVQIKKAGMALSAYMNQAISGLMKFEERAAQEEIDRIKKGGKFQDFVDWIMPGSRDERLRQAEKQLEWAKQLGDTFKQVSDEDFQKFNQFEMLPLNKQSSLLNLIDTAYDKAQKSADETVALRDAFVEPYESMAEAADKNTKKAITSLNDYKSAANRISKFADTKAALLAFGGPSFNPVDDAGGDTIQQAAQTGPRALQNSGGHIPQLDITNQTLSRIEQKLPGVALAV